MFTINFIVNEKDRNFTNDRLFTKKGLSGLDEARQSLGKKVFDINNETPKGRYSYEIFITEQIARKCRDLFLQENKLRVICSIEKVIQCYKWNLETENGTAYWMISVKDLVNKWINDNCPTEWE